MVINLRIEKLVIDLPSDKIDKLLELVNHHTHLLKEIKMTNEEALAELKRQKDKSDAQGVQLDKIAKEIQALKDLANNRTDIPQDVADAIAATGASIDALGTKVQTADDLNADAPADETPQG